MLLSPNSNFQIKFCLNNFWDFGAKCKMHLAFMLKRNILFMLLFTLKNNVIILQSVVNEIFVRMLYTYLHRNRHGSLTSKYVCILYLYEPFPFHRFASCKHVQYVLYVYIHWHLVFECVGIFGFLETQTFLVFTVCVVL